ncbi:MAG: hypothetical protein OER90_00905 [Gemmatimonadota bacterium]|nr:hypothetical protein [Gemmatimonadota bacterium]
MRYALSLGCVALALACGGVPPVGKCDAIILDMPHGEWRIHVHPDGSGLYAYGALPQLGRIEPGTFDFAEMHAQLADRVTAERQLTGAPEGTVHFCVGGPTCDPLWYFYDPEFADSLFDLAWAHRSAPSNELEQQDFEGINRIWAERQPD